MLVALAGGVGAAKFLAGVVSVVEPADVTVVVNTADDDWFHGLYVCPDLDSVTYTLAGANNPETGWGLADESFRVMDALERYGAPTWFRLGDRDLATHLHRTERLRAGVPLHQVTADVARAWGVAAQLVPMTDDRVATRIEVAEPDPERGTPTRELAMQEWFVHRRGATPVRAVRYDGAAAARPAPGVLAALRDAEAILVCPSNPVLSIGPILAVPGVRDALRARRSRVVGVSPIVAGAPVKGPADRLMHPLGIEVSAAGVARAYADFCGTLVVDARDAALAPAVEASGVRAVVTDTVMRRPEVAAALAREALAAVA